MQKNIYQITMTHVVITFLTRKIILSYQQSSFSEQHKIIVVKAYQSDPPYL